MSLIKAQFELSQLVVVLQDLFIFLFSVLGQELLGLLRCFPAPPFCLQQVFVHSHQRLVAPNDCLDLLKLQDKA